MQSFNPLVDSFDDLSDSEVDQKIVDLQKKYFMSQNLQVQSQIASILDMYREEARARQQKAYAKMNQSNDDADLDNLINVS